MPNRPPADNPLSGGPANSGGSSVLGTDITTVVVYDNLEETVRATGVSTEQTPGDLGYRFVTNQTQDLLTRAYRSNSSLNLFHNWNHRFRGQREAFKFNLLMQQVGALSALVFCTLEPRNRAIRSREFLTGPTHSATPTSSEVALICHIRAQIDFKEYLLLKDADILWFNP